MDGWLRGRKIRMAQRVRHCRCWRNCGRHGRGAVYGASFG